MQKKRLSIYLRGGRIFLVPTVGGLDAQPVFQCIPQTPELAGAIEGALLAVPTVDLPKDMSTYRSPVMALLNLKSGSAFERGLKSANLDVSESYRFFRFVPLPKYKRGLIREDQPLWTLPQDAPSQVIANHMLSAFDDALWPTR